MFAVLMTPLGIDWGKFRAAAKDPPMKVLFFPVLPRWEQHLRLLWLVRVSPALGLCARDHCFITLFSVIAIVGFVAAGLGRLGVRPVHRSAAVSAGAAGLWALAAQFWHADTDLWPGVLLSASLPLATVLLDRASMPEPRHRWAGRVGTVVGWAFLLWIGVSAVAWPWHGGWGVTSSDWATALPGDHRPRTPQLEILHAVTRSARPSAMSRFLHGLPRSLSPRSSLPHFIMQRRMMLGIKALAERAHDSAA
jgi:hypothetical protein